MWKRMDEQWANAWVADGKVAVRMGRKLEDEWATAEKRRDGGTEEPAAGGLSECMEGWRDEQLRDRGTVSPLLRGRARQDGERWASALQRAQREALEREATRGAEQARQQELIRDMKERLLELLR